MSYRFVGFGDVLNPTAGTALDCGLFAGGVFKPECWCLDFPSLCSQADYTAAYEMAHPETIAPVQAPPPVGSPVGSALIVPPASGESAQQTIDALLTQQMKAWKAQNQATMADTQAAIDAVGKQYAQLTSPSTWPWYLWLGLGLGVFAVATLGMGGPRRYGR